MHNKTWVSALGWILSVGGWFFWTLVLAALYKPSKTYLLYPIYRDFLDHYGRNLLWWLVLGLTLAALCLFEIGVSSVRKTFWPTDTEVFQELQKDPIIRQRFEDTVRNEEEGHANETEMGRDKKGSEEERIREGEILELLKRPRVMAEPTSPNLRKRLSMGTDPEDEERMGKFRHSVEISEVLRGRA